MSLSDTDLIRKIKKLPDWAALEQLTRTLWRASNDGRGAAVMVGAGFSRNAQLLAGNGLPPPLWSELAAEMAARLGYAVSAGDAPQPPTDPLRLAEEYEQTLGRAALNEFIRDRICDTAWLPSALHHDLLHLPWSDVLTTNWDRLLERAAEQINREDSRDYHFVTKVSDLSYCRAPRIVKLHGSLGSLDNFIVTQEDYRTYPRHYAPFVNLVRQIFIENELCLIGFSGDDPNFLHWAGWVRDEMGPNARKIYLIDLFNLSVGRRKYLESQNISPIDLTPLLDTLRLQDRQNAASEALRLLMRYFRLARPEKPQDWLPTAKDKLELNPDTFNDSQRRDHDAVYAAQIMIKAIDVWRDDRRSYPRWLICPNKCRQLILLNVDYVPVPTDERLAQMAPDQRDEFLYELSWQIDTGFLQPSKTQRAALTKLADPGTPSSLGQMKQLDIAARLLNWANLFSEAENIEKLEEIITNYAEKSSDHTLLMLWWRARRALFRLDFESILVDAEAFSTADDPIWWLRLGLLFCECGNFADGFGWIDKSWHSLKNRLRRAPASVWLISRLAWAEYFARVASANRDKMGLGRSDRPGIDDNERREFPEWPTENWPKIFDEYKCDSIAELRIHEDRINKEFEKITNLFNDIYPLFEAGQYRKSNVIFNDSRYIWDFVCVKNIVGIPLNFGLFNITSAITKKLIALHEFEAGRSSGFYQWIVSAATNQNDAFINKYLSRIYVACACTEEIDQIISNLKKAIIYWLQKYKTAQNNKTEESLFIDQLRIVIEIYARLAIRLNATDARAAFDLAMDLAAEAHLTHWWLFEPIGHLAAYAAAAIPPASQSSLALPCLLFPLASEKQTSEGHWPEPMAWWPDAPVQRPADDPRWGLRISQLIDAVMANNHGRRAATLRLGVLLDNDLLTDGEHEAFAQALWAHLDSGEPPLPDNTGCFYSTYARLPGPARTNVRDSVKARLFDDYNIHHILNSKNQIDILNWLVDINRVFRRFPHLQPTPPATTDLFDRLIALAPATAPDGEHPFIEPIHQEKRRRIAEALAAIAPHLPAAARTEARARTLLAQIDAANLPHALPALVEFLPHVTENGVSAELVRRIDSGLTRRSQSPLDAVGGAAKALIRWGAEQADPPPPVHLVEKLVQLIEARRDGGTRVWLACARRMLGQKRLDTAQQARLAVALGDLLHDTDYATMTVTDPMAVSLSLLRAECARLAAALTACGGSDPALARWIAAASADPLPEVRFYADMPPDEA